MGGWRLSLRSPSTQYSVLGTGASQAVTGRQDLPRYWTIGFCRRIETPSLLTSPGIYAWESDRRALSSLPL